MINGANSYSIAQKESAEPEQISVLFERNNSASYEKYIKRLLDVFFALLLTLLISPLLSATAIIIKLESRGHVVFKQERLGFKDKEFVIFKFRSMRSDAEIEGPVWAEKDDDRTTRFGRFIRKYHIDELPQLINIIRGDMSFVGPRPEREYFYNKFEVHIPGFRARLAVKPGLTGLAQINGGYDIEPEEKLKYDLEYINMISFKADLVIFFKTIFTVLRGAGAR